MFSAILFLSAIVISGIAEFYSIAGLVAIFSSQATASIVMGLALGVGKLVAASWVYRNWNEAPKLLKYYFTIAVVILSFITSMGIFGYLSKAHLDQSIVIGDSSTKLAIYDEKIKTEKENIEANRKALKQMDDALDQVLGRSTDEKGADKAVYIRRTQQKERTRLQKEIFQSQQSIAQLNDARAPIAAEVRKVEAEVGPIKYVAELIYGESSDEMIGKAVRLMIILIIFVFDPLAILLLIAANMEMRKNAPCDRVIIEEEEEKEMIIPSAHLGSTPKKPKKPIKPLKPIRTTPKTPKKKPIPKKKPVKKTKSTKESDFVDLVINLVPENPSDKSDDHIVIKKDSVHRI